MIESKHVDLYARNSGMKDKLVAERDVVLTYALRGLIDNGIMSHLAFKGGTCLRKVTFGSSGRFSEDLDFTFDSEADVDDILVQVVACFNREHYGIRFEMDDYYKTDEDTSFGGDVLYHHAWNNSGRFRLQISLRERPTLPVLQRPLKAQGYFSFLEFASFAVRAMDDYEMIAEKIRAAYQRAKVRDLYDLYRFSTMPFDNEQLRSLVVLKLWQVRDPFDPDFFFDKIRNGAYDWDDLHRLMHYSKQLTSETIITAVESRFDFLRNLNTMEQKVIGDAIKGRSEGLIEKLRIKIRQSK